MHFLQNLARSFHFKKENHHYSFVKKLYFFERIKAKENEWQNDSKTVQFFIYKKRYEIKVILSLLVRQVTFLQRLPFFSSAESREELEQH